MRSETAKWHLSCSIDDGVFCLLQEELFAEVVLNSLWLSLTNTGLLFLALVVYGIMAVRWADERGPLGAGILLRLLKRSAVAAVISC